MADCPVYESRACVMCTTEIESVSIAIPRNTVDGVELVDRFCSASCYKDHVTMEYHRGNISQEEAKNHVSAIRGVPSR